MKKPNATAQTISPQTGTAALVTKNEDKYNAGILPANLETKTLTITFATSIVTFPSNAAMSWSDLKISSINRQHAENQMQNLAPDIMPFRNPALPMPTSSTLGWLNR